MKKSVYCTELLHTLYIIFRCRVTETSVRNIVGTGPWPGYTVHPVQGAEGPGSVGVQTSKVAQKGHHWGAAQFKPL